MCRFEDFSCTTPFLSPWKIYSRSKKSLYIDFTSLPFNANQGITFQQDVLTFTLSEQPYALAFEKPRSQYELNHHLIVYSYSFIVRNISVLPTTSMCVALCIHLCMNHSLSDLAKSCKVKMRGVTLV